MSYADERDSTEPREPGAASADGPAEKDKQTQRAETAPDGTAGESAAEDAGHAHAADAEKSEEAEQPDELAQPAEAEQTEDEASSEKAGVFRALKVRNYRLYFTGNVISQTGTWMNRVAQDWLVLQLTDDDPVALGIATALQFGPVLVFSLMAGTVADRFDKRRLLIWLQVILGVVGVALGFAAAFHVANIWHLYLACLLVGIAATFDGPTRQAFVMEMVDRPDVTNAVALNSLGFNGARIVGPAVAGVLIALIDTGPVMAVSGFAYVAVIISLARMRPSELHVVERLPRTKGQIRAGIKYIGSRRDLKMIMLMVFMVSTFGMNFQLTLAIMARIVFQRDATSYGLLSTTLAVGSLLGALASARRSDAPRLRLLAASAIAFGLIEVVMGLTESYVLLAALLVPGGMFMLVFANAANAALQLGSSAEMRSRVMSIYLLVFLGGAPFISPLLGYVAEWFGGGAPLWMGGAITAASSLVLALWIGRSAKMHVEIRVHPVPHLHLVDPLAADEEKASAAVAHRIEAITGTAKRAVAPAASRVARAGKMLGRTVARPGRGPRGGGRR